MSWSFARWLAMGRKAYNEPLVTVVRLSGVLRAPGPGPGRALSEQRVERWLQKAFSKSLRPAAVAVCVNSPGGSPAQSDLIHRLIRRLSKQTGVPVYTFAEDVAASGGYWLLCAGDKVHALEGSLVGSIGVISATFGAQEAISRLGLERRVWTAGDAKAQVDPFLPAKPEQVARIQDIMDDLHDTFIDVVKRSRGSALNGSDAELFSGRAWTGRQALKLGLVDGLGDMKGVMLEQLGDKTKFLLCSPTPSVSPLYRLFGRGGSTAAVETSSSSWAAWALAGGSSGAFDASDSNAQGSGPGQGMAQLLAGGGSYELWRAGMEAAMDVAEEQALWQRYKVG